MATYRFGLSAILLVLALMPVPAKSSDLVGTEISTPGTVACRNQGDSEEIVRANINYGREVSTALLLAYNSEGRCFVHGRTTWRIEEQVKVIEGDSMRPIYLLRAKLLPDEENRGEFFIFLDKGFVDNAMHGEPL